MASSSSSRLIAQTSEEKVAKFERFINDVLKESLRQISAELDRVNEQISELEDVRNTVETMTMLASELPAGKQLKTRVKVGCDFFMQAKPDLRTFLVCVGLDYYVEYTKDETLAHVQFRSKLLRQRADELRDQGAQVRAQITLALHCIQAELQGL
ncbi:protein UXT homolog [Myzus persicae]|uniref:protein UXT homolog n=1 Tax=Myzus persicae TaxID=13164 RepID=UPI000B930F21|nr:protein UXT homolog [Myzus persicae]XP_022163974.1 protein UXT homolog [Myzus persicae]XP_022163975.1 protein UXT homolog [Myzus persicae]